LKIYVIGYSSKNNDEGIRNICHKMYQQISERHKTQYCDVNNVTKIFSDLKNFNPDIIHFFVGPSTIFSFILCKLIRVYYPSAKIIISALQPGTLKFSKLIRYLKPDLVLVQTQKTERLFQKLGCNTCFLLNGVDTDRFVPVSSLRKSELREKYGFDRNKFIILHVGHIQKNRNISILEKLQNEDTQVVIIGSSSTPVDATISDKLTLVGCKIITDYLKNIEEVYALADCYVFPVTDRFNCVETPLSVFE
jgi:glycosyltransferase involved in cell wall biosynthesis